MSSTNPIAGLRQLTQILSVEGLARLTEDGRLEPSLAERWDFASDGRTLTVKLKAGVKFHDGSPLTPDLVATVLPTAMREWFGPIADDVEAVTAIDATTVQIRFRRPSPFAFEALEAGIQKGSRPPVGTGPFVQVPDSTSDLRANAEYYAGRPAIASIHVESFPAVRSAWAKMLRNELDMLWEVGPEALSSLEHSANVAVFTFTRRYQYVLVLNVHSPALENRELRRALNTAIDREKLVSVALNGHGVPSYSPVWPRYWAVDPNVRKNPYNPAEAAKMVNGGRRPGKRAQLRFSLLIAGDAVYERIALELKRQLESVGVDVDVRAVSQDEQYEAAMQGRYEAILMDLISGPTLLRPYGLWHSQMPGNLGGWGNKAVDAAFDEVRTAETESAYRKAVANLDQTFADDPPAIFLAWSVRARAISKRFAVQAEEGRDVISTLRLWKPTGVQQRARLN